MSNETQPSITKACINCGQEKPLSAFLEMSGSEGSTYGSICSSCRKTALEDAERRKKTDAEGSTTSESGHRIDTKAKVHGAIDKREQHQRTDEQYHEERKIDEEIGDKQDDMKNRAESGQKKHREEFLKKRTFLSGTTKTTATRSFGEKTKTNTKPKTDTVSPVAQDNEKTAQKAAGIQEDLIKNQHDFTVTNQGQQVAGQLRFNGQHFQQFRQWLGNAAPIVSNVNQTKEGAAPKQPGAIADPITKVKAKETPQTDPAVEFIEKNWRPGSKR